MEGGRHTQQVQLQGDTQLLPHRFISAGVALPLVNAPAELAASRSCSSASRFCCSLLLLASPTPSTAAVGTFLLGLPLPLVAAAVAAVTLAALIADDDARALPSTLAAC